MLETAELKSEEIGRGSLTQSSQFVHPHWGERKENYH